MLSNKYETMYVRIPNYQKHSVQHSHVTLPRSSSQSDIRALRNPVGDRSPQTSAGIAPLNAISRRFKLISAVIRPRVLGMVPVTASLCPKLRCLSLVRAAHWLGTVPVRRFASTNSSPKMSYVKQHLIRSHFCSHRKSVRFTYEGSKGPQASPRCHASSCVSGQGGLRGR